MVDVLVFGETRGEDLDSTTRELLGAAQTWAARWV